MNPGSLNRIITIQSLVITEVDNHNTETWSEAETIRAKVTMVDGSRFVRDGESIDRQVYKIEAWDNNYSDNIKIGYGDLVLYPIRPLTKNPGRSMMNEVIIYAATKASAIATV